jgi:hypothetical protein
MQRQSMKISTLATPLVLVFGLLASGASAMAQSEADSDDQHPSCSNRTLSGDYGNTSEGLLSPTPGAPPTVQFRSVGVYQFDGKGSFTGMEHTVVNGTPLDTDWTANSGTYSVNSNCTGKLVLNTPNAPVPLNIFFVVVRHGTEIDSVLDRGGALSGTWIKVREGRR